MNRATFETEQEKFWAGDFGSAYVERNQDEELLASNIAFFSRALKVAERPDSIIEFGANIGMNLSALSLLYPKAKTSAVEINSSACSILRDRCPSTEAYNNSLYEFDSSDKWDLVLSKGILIHLSPRMLQKAYERLVKHCRKYILVCEYYSPTPVEIKYRGERDRLFKRDYAGEILESHSEMTLLDYGFAYHRDPCFPQDDITWFLLQMK